MAFHGSCSTVSLAIWRLEQPRSEGGRPRCFGICPDGRWVRIPAANASARFLCRLQLPTGNQTDGLDAGRCRPDARQRAPPDAAAGSRLARAPPLWRRGGWLSGRFLASGEPSPPRR